MKKNILIFSITLLFIVSFFFLYIFFNNKSLKETNLSKKNSDSNVTESNIDDSNIENNSEITNSSYDEVNLNKAKKLLSEMSLEEKVGQMFFARCRKDSALSDLVKYNLGGFILFDANINGETKESLTDTITSYQSSSKLPMFIAIDEEGGTVNRISTYPDFRDTPFKSPRELYDIGGFQEIENDTNEKAKLLLSLGINMNLAPVADISTSSNDYIYDRTFGNNSKDVSDYISLVVKTMKENNLGSSLKHFPGYGDNYDTHTGFSIDKRNLESFKNSDFLPFISGIKAGASSILVSHNIIEAIDKDLPASLSPNINKTIREDLDFNGVIITDDLQMDAIKEYYGVNNSAKLAILAGNDLIISSDFDIQIPAVIDAINNGEITEERINESVLRILSLKYSLGILNI